MASQPQFRFPLDDAYLSLLGRVVCVFAYYEWNVIHLLNQESPGFLGSYCREQTLTAGQVKTKFRQLLSANRQTWPNEKWMALDACCTEFDGLIVRRNAVMHAHPMAAADGSTIVQYQAPTHRPISDVVWPAPALVALIADLEAGAIRARALF